jgi:hypothetical protein
MGATLRYAKVVDQEEFMRSGSRIRPGLESIVRLKGAAPCPAQTFYVVRAWDRFEGGFTERWRILDPHGRTVHEPVEREVLPEHSDIADEVADQAFEYADDGYQLVLEIDGREVARADFPVVEPDPTRD